jgi:hypothetical protein
MQRRIQRWLALPHPAELDLSDLELDVLPLLPQLTRLNCRNNNLTVLGPLPASLEALNCAFNQLRTLTHLPPSLEILSCHGNPLRIMRLPAGLKHLYGTADTWTALPPGLLTLMTAARHIGPLPPGLLVLHVWTRGPGHIRLLPDCKPAALREFRLIDEHNRVCAARGAWKHIVRRLHTKARQAAAPFLPCAALLYV